MSVLGTREQSIVADLLDGLDRPVPLRLELGPEAIPVTVLAGGREIEFGAKAQSLLEEIASLSDEVTLEVTETSEPGRYPAITIGPGLRYLGLPWGYELSALVSGIVAAGTSESTLSQDSQTALATIRRDVSLDVYVTPT